MEQIEKIWITRKRRPVRSLLEFILPIIIFLLILYILICCKVQCKDNIYEEIHSEGEIEYLETEMTKLFYAPSNDITDQIIQRTKEKTQLPTSNVYSFPNEPDLISKFLSDQSERIIGIFFNRFNDSLDYSFGYYEDNNLWDTDRLFGLTPFPEKNHQGSVYNFHGLLHLQQAIDTSYIEIKNDKPLDISIKLKEVPYPPGIRPTFDKGLFQISLILTYALNLVFLISNTMEEKSNGLLEFQYMNGLTPMAFWTSTLFFEILVSLIQTGFIAIGFAFFSILANDFKLFTNAWIFLLYCILYSLSVITYSLSICLLFKNVAHSLIIGVGGWIAAYMTAILLDTFELHLNVIIAGIASLLYPNVNAYKALSIIGDYELQLIGLQWNNINKSTNTYGLPFQTLIIVLSLNVIIAISFIYFKNCPETRIFRRSKEIKPINHATEKENHLVENNTMIELIGVTKKYEHILTVNNVSWSIPKNQITVMLGPNGAGKSTIFKMISGEIRATKGEIFLDQKSIKHSKQDIRKQIGVCSQDSRLFKDLTVKEHLLYFGALKGLSTAELTDNIEMLLKELCLNDSKNKKVSELSGGMKRKLSIAIALIGKPKILLLDEPSVEVDIQSQRQIWDFLKQKRQKSTILVSTHLMDEAEALGDYVAFIKNGQLCEYDTATAIKNRFDIGYSLKVILNTEWSKPIENEYLKLLEEYKIEGELIGRTTESFSVHLKQKDRIRFSKFLEYLEENKGKLRCDSFSITEQPLDNIFTKIPPGRQETIKEDISFTIDETTNLKCPTIQDPANFWTRIKILCLSRLYFLRQHFWIHIISIMFISLLYLSATYFTQNRATSWRPELKLNEDTYDKARYFYESTLNFSNIKNSLRVKNDVDMEMLNWAVIDTYQNEVLMGVQQKENYNFTIIHYTNALHSAPISLNLVTNVISGNHPISITHKPLNKDIYQKSKVVNSGKFILFWQISLTLANLLLISDFIIFPFYENSSNFLKIQKMAGIKEYEFWMVNFSLDVVIYLVKITLLCFFQWACSLIFLTTDVLLVKHWSEIGDLLRILILTGIANITVAYIYSKFRCSLGQCLSLFMIINTMCGVLPIVLNYIQEKCSIEIDKMITSIIFYIPATTTALLTEEYLSSIIHKFNWFIMTKEEYFEECFNNPDNICCVDRKSQECFDQYTPFSGNGISYALNVCYKLIFLTTVLCLIQPVYLRFVQGLFQRLILPKHISKSSENTTKSKPKHLLQNQLLSDKVSKSNKTRFSHKLLISDHNKLRNYLDVLSNPELKVITFPTLIKVYAKLAIKTFNIQKGKCFTLLGLNGAGKTTTLKILTNQILNNYQGDQINYVKQPGFCPQSNWINPKLTGRQILKIIGGLRGAENVDYYLNKFGLSKIADHPFETYSGGNQKIFSVLTALIGTKELAILDEPTNGVDPIRRQLIWKNLKELLKDNQLTIMLSSQNMLEAEALTDDLMILHRGKAVIQGKLQELKKKYRGYTVKLNISQNGDGPSLIQDKLATSLKTSIRLIDNHESFAQFYVNINADGHPKTSQLFKILEELLQGNLGLINYSIKESSVEDIFLSVNNITPLEKPNTNNYWPWKWRLWTIRHSNVTYKV